MTRPPKAGGKCNGWMQKDKDRAMGSQACRSGWAPGYTALAVGRKAPQTFESYAANPQTLEPALERYARDAIAQLDEAARLFAVGNDLAV